MCPKEVVRTGDFYTILIGKGEGEKGTVGKTDDLGKINRPIRE